MRPHLIAAIAACSALPLLAAAQVVHRTPHLERSTAPREMTLDGLTVIDRGLIGVGRIAASSKDFAGESLGSFSGLAIDLSTWRRNANGALEGTLLTLPDRGPNNIGGVPGTSNYRPRVHAEGLLITQAASQDSQVTISLRPAGGMILRDPAGAPFTGKDPGSNTVSLNGLVLPSPATGESAGRISLDPESMARLADGSFYVSDEYAAGIYYFDPAGRLAGVIQAPQALLPLAGGKIDFTGETPPLSGRRNNQGLEGVSVTPDGRSLVAILQSATLQDSGKGGQGRFNTRVLVYDLTGSPIPHAPVGHFVLQLPVVDDQGDGRAPNATAAASELLALDRRHFLVLARDSVGRGGDPNAAGTPVFKSVLLVSTDGATNLAGTRFETTATPISPDGQLDPSISPMRQAEVVNLLNPSELELAGLNLNTRSSNAHSISEKWEGMTLAPAFDPAAPDDVLLLISNDNDFVTAAGRIDGHEFDGSLKGERGAGDSDNMILAYRLTISRGTLTDQD